MYLNRAIVYIIINYYLRGNCYVVKNDYPGAFYWHTD